MLLHHHVILCAARSSQVERHCAQLLRVPWQLNATARREAHDLCVSVATYARDATNTTLRELAWWSFAHLWEE